MVARQTLAPVRCRAAWRSGHRRRWSTGRARPSSSAAFRHSARRVPSDSSATREPSPQHAALADFQRNAAAPACRRRRPRRADSGRRSGRRRCAAAVATMWTSSASSAAAITTMFGQAAEIGDVEGAGMGRAVGADQPGAVDREAHRQVLDAPRRARPGRRRAAGRWSRWRRTACSPRVARPAANVTACCSAMPTSKVRVGNSLANRSSPVPEGMAAVTATILSSGAACLDQALGEDARYRPAHWPSASPARR